MLYENPEPLTDPVLMATKAYSTGYTEGHEAGFQAGVASVEAPACSQVTPLGVGLGSILGGFVVLLACVVLFAKVMNQIPNPFAR